MKKNITIGAIIVVLFLLALWLSGMRENNYGGEQIACTMEALICPDGTGVGRSGPECRFNPCPSTPTFTGILQNVGEGYQLVIETPEEIVGDVTYALPLELRTTNVIAEFIGKTVRVHGDFIEGSTYEVTRMEEIPQEYSAPTAVLGVSESALIGYVRVTLNEIIEDSRCPVDVECIQAGRVVVSVSLESDTDFEVGNISSDGTSLLFDAYRVSVVDVDPARVASHTPEEEEYQITVMVEDINQ